MSQENLAIRFGLGAIKAVGFGMVDAAVKERESNGNFQDIYDFSSRLNPKTINKKSIEALSKAGAFDQLNKNRRQLAESFELLSSYATKKSEAASSNQMSLFSGIFEENPKPELKKVTDWAKVERLKKEFEAFGFFLNEHPLDDHLSDLKKRGVVFSDKIEKDTLSDNDLVKMSGVIAGSKHRSGPRGRFAYMTISDPLGIFEAMIFDEALITSARDILADGSMVCLECLIKKDDGGVRILIRDVKKLEDFIATTKAAEADFEDIKKQPARRNFNNSQNSAKNSGSENRNNPYENKAAPSKPFQSDKQVYQEKIEQLKTKKIFSLVQIIIKDRDPIFSIKSLLSQRVAPNNFEKFSLVHFSIMLADKVYKVELPEKYLLDSSDVAAMRKIEKVVDIECS